MKNIILSLALIFAIISCEQVDSTSNEEKKVHPQETDYLIMSTLWYQLSAERQALCYQSFNWATKMMDKHLDEMQEEEKPAVVVDIDETMLDNSPFEGKCLENNTSYTPETWKEWSDTAIAKPIPGALEFCNYAYEKGVEVFYVSNRKVDEVEATIKNMKDLGFPYLDTTNFLFKSTTSSKKERREKISEYYTILLLIGDNLGDFNEIFEDRSDNYGFDLVESNKEKFGDKFIMLPNPMYGDYEKAIFNYVKGLSKFQKDSIRRASLISY